MKILKYCKDFTKIIIAFSVANIMKLSKENRDIWLISERRDEAEDNGYHLFKYIRENHIDEKVFYVIDIKSKSYEKICDFSNIIDHNSLMHYIYYFLADKHISAFQFFGVPETPFLWKFEEIGLIKKKKIFIQHGITQADLPFLKYENTKYRLFICGAKKEYEYVKKNFNYPNENVKYTGFTRFDNLHEYVEKNQILVMPTWRQWLGMTNLDNDLKKDKENFINSDYYKTYNSLINSTKLRDVLNKHNFTLMFYPHPEMQRFINLFKYNNENIKIVNRKDSNLQNLLKESKLLITDYSSIAFDAAYMRKPLVYYQFDQDKYYKNHFVKGYFDCERDGFGPVIKDEEQLLEFIEDYIVNGKINSVYLKRAEEFFPIYDMNNCRRNYEAIKEI